MNLKNLYDEKRPTMRKSLALILVFILMIGQGLMPARGDTAMIEKAEVLPEAGWQKKAVFPDAWGYTDDTLAMNSMISFLGYHGQGYMYLDVAENVTAFTLYVNGQEYDTSFMRNGLYCIDFSDAARDGKNALQVSNILPHDAIGAVTVYIPYPVILPGSIEDAGIRPETLQEISDTRHVPFVSFLR